jgi:hypothetical protein
MSIVYDMLNYKSFVRFHVPQLLASVSPASAQHANAGSRPPSRHILPHATGPMLHKLYLDHTELLSNLRTTPSYHVEAQCQL